jgi:hypothetical protein
MSKKFLVNINMGGNQIVSPVLNAAIIYGTLTDPGSGSTGQIFYNTTSNTIKYWNGTAWTPLSTGGTAVSSLNSFSGGVTIVGTANQIAVTNATGTITLSLPTNVTLPGKTTLTASTTSGSSLNIPAAVSAPSAPTVGDIWTTASTGANILYYNGATKTVAFTDSNITGSAGSVANSLTIGNGLTVAGPYNGSAAVTVSLPSTITAGSVGSGTAIPIITYDTYGRITAVSTASISSSISLAGQTGTGSVSTGGTLTITNGSGITTSVTGSTFTITNSGVLSVNGSTGAVTGLATLASPTFTGTVTVPASGIVYPGSTSGQSILAAPATAGTNTAITLPATAGTLALNNQTFYLGSTAITINQGTGTLTSITGLSITGNAGTATTLATSRNINGVAFNGSADITVKASTTNALTIGTGLSGTSFDGSGAVTIANTGVLSITGTASQVIASASTGAVTLSLPQSIATTSTPTFSMVTISGTTTNATDVATKAYVDTLKAGFNMHEAVEAATTTDLTTLGTWGTVTYTAGSAGGDGGTGVGATLTPANNGVLVIDNYTPDTFDRVLIKNQTDPKQNGAYSLTTAGSAGSKWTLTRSTDYDNNVIGLAAPGDLFYVDANPTEYTITPTNNNTSWIMNNETGTATNQTIKIGTDNITFVQFSGPGTVTGGTGITVTGNSVAITAINPTSTTDTSTKGIVSALTVNSQGQVTAQTTTALGTEFTNASGTINIASASIADTKLATISTAGKVLNSATTATNLNTASAIVARDASGNFVAGTITAALTGNASTATTLATPRAINGVNFDGSAAITIKASTTNAITIGTGLTFTGGSTFDGSAAGTLSLSATYTQKYATTFTGGTSANPFTVNHALNTRDVTVQVYDNATYDEVEVDILRTDANNVTITFSTISAPTSGQNYRIVVIG